MATLLTTDDLRRALVECAGETDGTDLSGDFLDLRFEDIGYDSLALMETAARLESRYGVSIPDDVAGRVDTPRELLDLINGALAEAA
ncbi:acyl carrier protein [Streptomyces violaceoruber]|uniref:Actinorhodin polyketide synthase acyl carrier protein n=7 Tax=Streptomyces TaxID=1883 RepID=ACPX_STRCO|nr:MULTISPECIES: acyl carrier protein [Streptomyces]Q02054.1 RecName: Full=Actinorhodin polyketide synthase acyl carrier protein; Short=ACP; AltName: Full=actI ORF3 [Streptomyces coelicolor A3(2)]1AF8_A Chain A, ACTINORHODIN POLYKETIDE SYNTHASE ACYL CARRIER PROTEIN [Streptomyces coelicolor A3(2)]2AF8_A Chain A, ACTINORHODIN POLYKETIDE SYNTHASE ACYL CARRIER PROTEIN [Streptomyces coelicolor A3(2)]QSJ09100.1 actinorhodin polyketide synthase ACP [Streptomyces lividans]AIJ13577.1 actinorhodin polyk